MKDQNGYLKEAGLLCSTKMREPGEAVTDHQTKRKVNPVAASDNPHEQNNAEQRADEMQIAR